MPASDYTYKRQGQEVINYKGLLHLAHERWGDKGFDLEVAFAHPFKWGDPCFTAAKLTCPVGTFRDVGDASPENVGQNIKPHYPRMAATRAKARVLRDALDIAAVAVEELSDDDGSAMETQRGAAQKAEPPPTGRKGELLKQIRDNLRTVYGDKAVDAERRVVSKSESRTPFNKLSEDELEKLRDWSESKAVEYAEAQAKSQAEQAEQEGNSETPGELDDAAEQEDFDEIPF